MLLYCLPNMNTALLRRTSPSQNAHLYLVKSMTAILVSYLWLSSQAEGRWYIVLVVLVVDLEVPSWCLALMGLKGMAWVG